MTSLFEPVVLLGRGAQVSLLLAAFWHAARLANLQFNAPPSAVTQNLPEPITRLELPPIVPFWSIDEP
jgi:hypothetical protein